ncbi:type II toxin-antitoxin system HipA family toxin [Carboxylicivirga sediminis]|uniref:Type II toxin-antitoxin system HipA family toxin n=1 Tax=Carboxylicivirga sediminis TaxID=2006564 RepID=A0A941IYM5_9BACT|nr:type II toxin-antitoxin system HipA family toxin [Carboxylicivirga sediminis]MBR8536654.1 type II toxin-antitoxin system HipA family toxin [Carboxylicivirga sediminis]
MDQISNILVSLNIEGKAYEVGELVINNQTIYFRYHLDFIRSGLNISPIRLPFNNEINTTSKEPFDGLYGVFNDSLPDGWGRLLLDRTLSSKGIDIHQLTPLDRLAFVGDKGMGALSYRPQFEDKAYQKQLELDMVAQEMSHVLKGESTELLDELFAIGGSSGGARPKILVAYNKVSSELIHGVNDLSEGFEDWIIKFPSSSDNEEIAHIEYAYYKMALAAGIKMSECQLFHGQSGHAYFGTKRFDRIQGRRLHMHTACGIMHDNFRMSTMDYGHLMDCAFQLERHVNAYDKVLRLAAFNVFAHNRDDHSKNFAFLMDGKGNWQFAPAYDLTFSHSAFGFHSTMIAGESKNPGKEHLLKLAETFKVKKANQIIEEVREAISQWDSIANDSGVSKRVREQITKHIL